MQYVWMSVVAAAIVALDQFTKYLVVAGIPPYAHVEAIPGLFHLTYVQNVGAAFSILEGQQWFFALVFALLTVAIVWEFSRKRIPFTRFERWCIVAVYAGGLGNMIDRLRLGYVVDMIATDFMEFPVFNVADCFITCGCIGLIAHLALCNREFWREEKKQ